MLTSMNATMQSNNAVTRAHATLLCTLLQVVTDLANASDRSQSKLPDRKSELRVLQETLMAKSDQEEKDEKKMLDRDMDDIGEGSARGTVSFETNP